MTRGKRSLLLRLGIIFTATGIISLTVLGRHHHLPPGVALPLGIALVVVGVPLLIAGVRSSAGKSGGKDSS